MKVLLKTFAIFCILNLINCQSCIFKRTKCVSCNKTLFNGVCPEGHNTDKSPGMWEHYLNTSGEEEIEERDCGREIDK